jgi:hypothetical protein
VPEVWIRRGTEGEGYFILGWSVFSPSASRTLLQLQAFYDLGVKVNLFANTPEEILPDSSLRCSLPYRMTANPRGISRLTLDAAPCLLEFLI